MPSAIVWGATVIAETSWSWDLPVSEASRLSTAITMLPVTVSSSLIAILASTFMHPVSAKIIAKAGGTIRPGGDGRVFIVRTNEQTREVSVADRVGDLGIRASDQLYVQDPPFVVRNELAIRSAYELVQFGLGLLTIYYLIRRD